VGGVRAVLLRYDKRGIGCPEYRKIIAHRRVEVTKVIKTVHSDSRNFGISG
jgi:hypothetical protein